MNKSYVHQHEQTSNVMLITTCCITSHLFSPTHTTLRISFFPAWANFPFLLDYPHEHATCYPYLFLCSLLATIQVPATLQQNSLKGLIILDIYNSPALFPFLCVWGRGRWSHPCHAGILVPSPGTEPMPPALGAESLKHWTTRESPPLLFLNLSKFSFTFQQQMPQSIIPKFCVCFFYQFYIFNR